MIDKLEMFIALAHAKHFGKAAEAVGVTQPTLSAAIRQLESQLGVMLVRRGSRFVGLTPEGEKALVWARRIAGDARVMRAEISELSEGMRGQLRIGVIPTALSKVSELTAAFSARYPHVTYTILSRTSEEIASLVDDLALDAGVTYLNNEPMEHMVCVPLYAENYLLVLSEDMDAPKGDVIDWKAIGDLPLCLLTREMQNRRIVDAHLEQAGVAARPMLESDSMITLISHVRTGRWASVMPQQLVAAFGETKGLRLVPIEGAHEQHQVGLIAAEREPQMPLVSALMEVARGYAKAN